MIFKSNLVFIESDGFESKNKGATSYFNEKEVEIVFNLVGKYASVGMKKDDIGVISPYNEQVKKIKERMPFVEVNSIDGFQGREKNIIIISLVRSNNRQEIGFLKDLRRLNVALTRAINELVIIGNRETIEKENVYRDLIDFIRKNGQYLDSKDRDDFFK
jgi:superfamily I DNA and/or RNA helicase